MLILLLLSFHMSPWAVSATGAALRCARQLSPCSAFSCRMFLLRPSPQSSHTATKSTPRPSCGSRETPKHPMKPGKSVFLSEVCLFLKTWENSPSYPCPDNPTLPAFLRLSFPYLSRTSLPTRGRWQWEVPQQIRAPPSLFD